MVQKSLGRVPRPVIALGAFLSFGKQSRSRPIAAAQRGLTLVRVHCAQCHAIDKVSDTPLPIAPPFRTCISNSRSRAYAGAWPKALLPTIRRYPISRLDPDQLADVMAFEP